MCAIHFTVNSLDHQARWGVKIVETSWPHLIQLKTSMNERDNCFTYVRPEPGPNSKDALQVRRNAFVASLCRRTFDDDERRAVTIYAADMQRICSDGVGAVFRSDC